MFTIVGGVVCVGGSLSTVTTTTTSATGSQPPQSQLLLQMKPSQLHVLTPSLANYYKEDLIHHVTAWPGDTLQKQVIIKTVQ